MTGVQTCALPIYFNFDNGRFINNPAAIPEGNGPQPDSFSQQSGVNGVDYNETRTSPRAQDTLYRGSDPVRMQHTLDYLSRSFQTRTFL